MVDVVSGSLLLKYERDAVMASSEVGSACRRHPVLLSMTKATIDVVMPSSHSVTPGAILNVGPFLFTWMHNLQALEDYTS